jgi:hypothetical protein
MSGLRFSSKASRPPARYGRHLLLVLGAFCSLGARAVLAQQTAAQPADTPATHDSVVQDPRAVQPERPTVATHAYTVAPGYLEIEAGVQEAKPSAGSQFVAPVVVKIGLASRLQLEVQGGYAR